MNNLNTNFQLIDFFKNGSGIHIKKKNRGLFKKYCNGHVTDECIRRGKNSQDPKIRRRATFAQNARHFKHENGGLLFNPQAMNSLKEILRNGNKIKYKPNEGMQNPHKTHGNRSVLDNGLLTTQELKTKKKR